MRNIAATEPRTTTTTHIGRIRWADATKRRDPADSLLAGIKTS